MDNFEDENKIGIDLTVKQDLFCKYFALDYQHIGNATMCYALAYQYDLDSMDKTREKDSNGIQIVGSSEYDKGCNVCAVGGHRLLRNDKIQEKIIYYLNSALNDQKIDSELSKLILQNNDYTAKLNAIKEYNKLKQRITEKQDLTTNGKDLPTPIIQLPNTDTNV